MPRYLLAALCAFGSISSSHAGDSLHDRIDGLIAAGHPNFAKQAAPLADDSEFLRRACLDLRGSIPTARETRAFLADPASDKREKLIDSLLAAPEYARRMTHHFDVLLNERRKDVKVLRADWEKYLTHSFTANRPFDLFVREILSADGVDNEKRAPAKFFLDRDFEANIVTRDIARLFLGRNLQCAQCHDHPTITDYKQEHYFGIYAFLSRTFLFPKANLPTAVLAEKADGDTNFMSVFDKTKTQKTTTPKMPGGKPIAEPKAEKGKEYTIAPTKPTVRPVPAFSRRALLAMTLTADRNFARASVNRFWAFMMGRGLIHPLDLDHGENPPSHPELLDILTDEFIAHKYDVKWLIRELALTETYQRSSVVPTGLETVPEDRYLVAALKPLSPEQMAYAIVQASGQADADRTEAGAKAEGLTIRKTLPISAVFAGPAGEPEDSSTATLDQTLFLKFGPVMRDMLAKRPNSLVDRLSKQKDARAVAEELFLSVLTRKPSAEEITDVADALKAKGDPEAIHRELVWSLMASGEFRFNH